jgi:hypothetical protein
VDREGKPAPRRSRERRVVHVRSKAVIDEARFRRRRERVPVPTGESRSAVERALAEGDGLSFNAEARAPGESVPRDLGLFEVARARPAALSTFHAGSRGTGPARGGAGRRQGGRARGRGAAHERAPGAERGRLRPDALHASAAAFRREVGR